MTLKYFSIWLLLLWCALPLPADAGCCAKTGTACGTGQVACVTPDTGGTQCNDAGFNVLCANASCNPSGPTETVTLTPTNTATATSTATNTATATAASFYQDNFNRTNQDPLTGCPPSGTGTCWADTSWDGGSLKLVNSTEVMGNNGTGSAFTRYTVGTPNTAGSWACIKTGGTDTAATWTGVGFANNGLTPDRDMVDCETDSSNNTISHGYVSDAGSWSQWSTAFTVSNFAVGDYIAIVHTGGNVVQCFYCMAFDADGCDAASEWKSAGNAVDLDTLGGGNLIPLNASGFSFMVYGELADGWKATGFAAGNTVTSGKPDQPPTACSGG